MKNKLMLSVIIFMTLFVSCHDGNIGVFRDYSNLEVFDSWYVITEMYHSKEYDETELNLKFKSFQESFIEKFLHTTPILLEEQSILDHTDDTINIIVSDMECLKEKGFGDELSDSLVNSIDYRMYFLENWYYWMESEKNTKYIMFYIVLSITVVLTGVILMQLNNRELKKKNREIFQSKNTLKFVIKAQEEERTRISRELHDSLAQDIRYIGLLALKIEDENLASEIQEKQAKCINEIRSLCYNFTPPDVGAGDLVSALITLVDDFKNNSGIECRLTIFESLDFSVFTTDELMHFYRIVQEALSNIQKHAKATEATVLFRGEKEESGKILYKLIITDDGCGIDNGILNSLKIMGHPLKKKDGAHFGLSSIRERTALLDGEFQIDSVIGDGTQIKVCVRR